jgi:hypothetical protein
MESWKRVGIKITSLSEAHGCLERSATRQRWSNLLSDTELFH